MLIFGACKFNIIPSGVGQYNTLKPQLLLKSDGEINFFSMGKNSYFVIANSFYIIKSGVKTDLGKQLSIFTNETTQLKYFNGNYYILTRGGLYEINETSLKVNSYFSANETLCSNYVNSVDSSMNFLVIGTDQGLTIHTLNPAYNIQFDNYRDNRTNSGWYTFKTDNSPILSNNIISCYVNGQDIVMITDKGVSIYHWASDYFESYSLEEYFNNEHITNFMEFQGNYYFTSINTLFEFETLSKSWKSFDPSQLVSDFRITKIVKNTTKIFFLSPGAIFDFNVFSETFELIVSTDTFYNKNFLDFAYKDSLYLGTNLGLYILNSVDGTNKNMLSQKPIKNIVINTNEDIYITTDYEIYQLK